MRFQGNLYKDGKFWLAEVPIFAAMTQGRTRKEALAMIADWFETIINRPGFSVTVHEGKTEDFELSASDTKAEVAAQALRHGGPYLLGETFTGADVLFTTCLTWADFYRLPLAEVLADYRQRLTSREAYRRAAAINYAPR